MIIIPLQVQLTQITPFTMYTLQKQQTQFIGIKLVGRVIVWRVIVVRMIVGRVIVGRVNGEQHTPNCCLFMIFIATFSPVILLTASFTLANPPEI